MILHIPHSSYKIPAHLRDFFVLSDDDLTAELIRMTDAFTDELFTFPDSFDVRFLLSRLLVDVERFPDDAGELMSKVGMGMIYTHTAHGEILKRKLQPPEKKILLGYYERHHEALSDKVRIELEKYGKALILDCHSFPSQPLPCDSDQGTPRPDLCIGTDSFHTPPGLIDMVENVLKKMGYSLGIDRPYKGTIVPMEFFGKDRRVTSLMIEVNRGLYMDESTGKKNGALVSIQRQINAVVQSIRNYEDTPPC